MLFRSDSGSDLTLMQKSVFCKLFNNARQLLKPRSDLEIKSYSGDKIKIVGELTTQMSFRPTGKRLTLSIIVVEDIVDTVALVLFGNDALAACLALIDYQKNLERGITTPKLYVKHPEMIETDHFYDSPRLLNICTGEYFLEPHESTVITMKLHPAAPVVAIDKVLITPLCWKTAQIINSRSRLQFDHSNNCYLAYALITNLSNQSIKGTIEARVEVCKGYKTYKIVEANKDKILELMKRNPPAKEVLQQGDGYTDLPLPTVCSISVKNSKTYELESNGKEVKELLLDTVGSEKVSYTGTAEMSPDIIEGGLEVPTIIHNTPEEALNVEEFTPEIRPYIKDIFLNKYPNVVALHSLDGGDVSKTLGYTTLRLIPGETLPRHRRIYQLSPQDSNYLEELLEQFIRFNYVRRAPVDSTNLHLYGMSTYMVPRKKPTDMARLVIDFSPLTSIIQSPPSVIPDITASLQQLQGKAMFSSMDLKYAYLALRISEESKSLTTFLTQKGVYQWETIPTGASCSPSFFVDAINRILHYKPVLDKHGNPIYDQPNKVRLVRDVLPFSFHYFDDIICSTELKSTYQETMDYHFECLEKIIYRLSFHGVKVSVNKCDFAKPKILFLGWIISHDYIIPDPRRMEKIRLAKFPKTKKEVRSFLGLVNSIRRVVPLEVIKEIQVLTPLTSSTTEFKIKDKHITAFENIKDLLLREPLFCNLIKPEATKILWVDAASSSGCLGAVLAQQISEKDDKMLPEFLNFDNKVHRIIYDKGLNYEPCKLYTEFPIDVTRDKIGRAHV